MIEKGVIVELPEVVDGFVPISQLEKEGIRKPSDAYKVGDEIELAVIEFNKENKKIILSEKRAHGKGGAELALDDEAAIQEYEQEGAPSSDSKKSRVKKATVSKAEPSAPKAETAAEPETAKADSAVEAPEDVAEAPEPEKVAEDETGETADEPEAGTKAGSKKKK
jgi:small subunit ribosomal protein S1